MATEKQTHANQENAKHSTGPSEAGKANSAGNNFKHGLCPTDKFFVLLPDESMEDFVELITELRIEHNCETATEFLLVGRMAESEWMRARAAQLQTKTICLEPEDHDKKLNLYMRYATAHEKSFYKALNALQKLRKERANSEIGFKREELKQASEIRAAVRQNLSHEALAFKKDELLFKKEVFQTKKSPVPAPKTPSGDLKMAA